MEEKLRSTSEADVRQTLELMAKRLFLPESIKKHCRDELWLSTTNLEYKLEIVNLRKDAENSICSK